MKQLNDYDLIEKLLVKEIVKSGLPEPYCNLNTHDDIWYSKDSPVQPSSLDLHVGEIFIPSENEISRDSYCLSSGQTVIITTSEELNLKSNISAFGFPPDKLSQNGILMVNLGHIDPGWQGKIKFVLINVGKEDYPIQKNAIVSTFLFYELDENVKVDYKQRRQGTPFPILPNVLNITKSLSKDFLDIDKRVNDIVKKTVDRNTLFNGIIGTVAVALISGIGYFYSQNNSEKINNIKIEVQSIKKDYEYNQLKNEVDSLKKTIHKFELTKGSGK